MTGEDAARPRWPVAVDLFAAALILVTAAHTWLVRFSMNPDGVSYLDLAGRLREGDLGRFVQGYWSPAYPALLGLLSFVTGNDPATMTLLAHLVNGIVIIGAILLLHAWGRRAGRPGFAVAALAALMLASTGLPRIEAVTPDLLSLALMAWLGYELLGQGGRRWAATGIAMGLVFLAKTSAWPWLLLGAPLRWWWAREAPARRDVLRSSVVALAIALLWVVPLSLKEGHLTPGSAARLNYCWYIEACDSRAPDTHRGEHTAYRVATVAGAPEMRWADFGDDTPWTYTPWSDPTAWADGLRTLDRGIPTAPAVLRYWRREAGHVLFLWLPPLLLGVVLPWILLEWPARAWRDWRPSSRPELAAFFLGAGGVVQFTLIHPEPRLIAPSALLAALALLHAPVAAAEERARWRRRLGTVARLGFVVVVGVYAAKKLGESRAVERRNARMEARRVQVARELQAAGLDQARVVVVGPAFPVTGLAYRSGARIIAQVRPEWATELAELPPRERHRVLLAVFGRRADLAWFTNLRGEVERFRIAPLPEGAR